MKLSTLAGAAAGHAKSLAVLAAIAAAGTTGGIVANTVANTQASTHLATVGITQGGDSRGGTGSDADPAKGSHGKKSSHREHRVTRVSCGSETNHGRYVAGFARMAPSHNSSRNAHGVMVREAARSDCGKPTRARDHHEADAREAHDRAGHPTWMHRGASEHARADRSGTRRHCPHAHSTAGHRSGRAGD